MDYHSSVTHSPMANHRYADNGKLMLILSLFALVAICIVIALFHSYAGWGRHFSPGPDSIVINSGRTTTTLPQEGLELSVLNSIPTFLYDAASQDSPLECAVCLSEFVDKESGRVLPDCDHCFHIGCIDLWFCSRSNCPLCRAPVKPVENPGGDVASVGETSGSLGGSDYSFSSSSSLRNTPELVGIIVEVPKINLDFEDSSGRTWLDENKKSSVTKWFIP